MDTQLKNHTTLAKDNRVHTAGIAVFLFIMLLCCSIPASAVDSYTIGVLAKRGREKALQQWQPTALYLENRIPGTSFAIRPLGFKEIEAAVKEGSIDFIICNPALYIQLNIAYGAQRIATLKKIILNAPYTKFAGVVFTRADTRGITGLNDLKGRSFAAVSENSFGGWIMAWREMVHNGINPFKDFKQFSFQNTHDAVVRAVRNGSVDAGTVRTGILETMHAEGSIRINNFRIVYNGHENCGPHYPLLHSTETYPEWPFAKLSQTEDTIAEAVSRALIAMEPDTFSAAAGGYAGWTIPANYQPVRDCLKELRIGPYKHLGEITLTGIYRQHTGIILTAAFSLLLLGGLAVRIFFMNQSLQTSSAGLKREIKERKKTEESLRLTSNQLDRVINNSPDSILVTDASGCITMSNTTFLDTLGYRRDEVFAHHLAEFIPTVPDRYSLSTGETVEIDQSFIDNLAEMVMSFINDGHVSNWESYMLHKNGTLIPVEQNIVVIHNDKGETLESIAMIRDITQRRLSEKALQRANDQTNRVFETAVDGMVIGDTSGTIIRINQAMLDMLGYSEEEILGLHSAEFSPAPERTYPTPWGKDVTIDASLHTSSIEQIEKLYAEGTVTGWETWMVHKNGTLIPVEISITCSLDDNSEIKETVGIYRNVTERYLKAQEIVQIRNHLSRVISSTFDGILVADSTGLILSANRACCHMLGYSEEELIGRHTMEFSPLEPGSYKLASGESVEIDEGFFSLSRELIEQLFEKGHISGWETYMLHKDGHMVPVEESISLARDEKGDFIESIGVIRDTTLRREADIKIKETSSFLNNIITTTRDGIFVTDETGTIVRANPAMAGLLGYDNERELVGKHPVEFFPFDYDSGNRPAVLEKVFEEGFVSNYETQRRRKDGSVIDVEISMSLMKNDNDMPTGVVSAVRDISERKEGEKRLRRYTGLLIGVNNVFLKSFTCKSDEAVAAMCLAEAEEITGSGFGWIGELNSSGTLDTIALSNPGWDVCAMDKADATKAIKDLQLRGLWGKVISDEAPLIANDPAQHPDSTGTPPGHPAIRNFLGVPLRQGNKTFGMIALANKESPYTRDDVESIENMSTAFVEVLLRKRMEKELETYADELKRSNKELDDFAYIASHDLKEPLRGIHNYANFLVEDYGERLDEEGRKMLGTLTTLTKRLEDLINDLLTFSRVGRLDLAYRETDLQEAVEEVIETLKIRLQELGITIRIPHPLPTILCDSARIQEVFRNLITNAMKYNDKQEKWIEIGCSNGERPDLPVLYVRDNGIGIREKHLDSVFKIFKRLHGKDKYGGGTGAGLTIVKKIIERHGGTIRVESTFGEGTTFLFTLQGEES